MSADTDDVLKTKVFDYWDTPGAIELKYTGRQLILSINAHSDETGTYLFTPEALDWIVERYLRQIGEGR
jgi:hypothetical protein